MNAVEILLFIVKHKKEFPHLRRLSPVEVLARLPEKDERYKQEEEGVREILRGIR